MASDKNKSENSGTFAAVQFHDALTPERLDNTNYDEWSLNAQNKIRGRKRWGYVTEQRLHQQKINPMNMKHGNMKIAWLSLGFWTL
ncbi:hypothetical protein TSUD_388020 [Trifolium subterraneum]|uniref:Retrotransposon Copia-like N-terminal domain-containing protein n=1 Tax=Trifolium subterraneum TaxID=3900 RepID=A0A2Z6NDM3_TRISU|nr:hypothetical protein TSUD_388020 [Trifolium subterraneum]